MEPKYDGPAMWCGPNDGGIKRGDRADTGNNEARPSEGTGPGGSGVPGGGGGATGHPTGATDSLAESTGGVSVSTEDAIDTGTGIDDLYETEADDPGIGLTDIEDRPPEDWAANTGPAANQESAQEEIEAAPLEVPKHSPIRRKARKRT